MASLGAINEDVRFGYAEAEALSSACRNAANALESQAPSRDAWRQTGLTDFKGLFSRIFRDNGVGQSNDVQQLVTVLRDVARGVDQLAQEARKEQQRRDTARNWAAQHDDWWEKAWDWVVGWDEAPPVGPPAAQVSIAPSTPALTPRDTPAIGGGAGSGTSSARPSNVRSFASSTRSGDGAISGWPSALRGKYNAFTAACGWGKLEASGVWRAFDDYLDSNSNDARWADVIAAAFEAAGSGVVTLPDAALLAALHAAGVSVSRTDLQIEPPQAYGTPPTTGYADDPVNTATGNFLEPEVDLAFTGGCASLGLTRMYNSLNQEVGAFGLGWSSIADTRLQLCEDAARWVLPDGRQVVFPRLGEGWDRALGESFWIETCADGIVISDNQGGRWWFTPQGRFISTARGAGTRVTAQWDDADRMIELRHERGRVIRIHWEGDRISALSASDGRRVDFAYEDGRLVRADRPSGARVYSWCEAGLIAAIHDADGVAEVVNTYDEHRRVKTQRSRFGRTSKYAYLPGFITVVSDPDDSRANTWVSDHKGRLIGVLDTNGKRQSTSYDRWGNAVSSTDRNGKVTLREFDERGRLIRQVSPSGADVQTGWDELDRVTTLIAGGGDAGAAAITYYEYEGKERNPAVLIDPTGGRTELEWADGLLSRVVDPTGVAVEFTYDVHGDLIATTDAIGNTACLERDASGRVVAALSPLGHRTEFRYDERGNLVSVRDATGATWRYTYSAAGRRTSVIDPLGNRSSIEYDAHGAAAHSTDPLGRVMSREFDDLGNLAALRLPDGATWRYTHDALSRLVSATDPAGGVWTNEFDANGQLTGQVDPTGVRQHAQSDATGNVLSADDGLASRSVRFDVLGRPVERQGADGSEDIIVYDACGRPVEALGPEGGLTRYQRDAAGRVVERVSPGGRKTLFEYDACGRLAATTSPAGGVTRRHYDADGRVVRQELPSGAVAWAEYDAAGRVTKSFQPGRGSASYGYDKLGRVVFARDTWFGTRRFAYDAAGQLATVTNGAGGVTRFAYDELGRRTQQIDPVGGVTRYEWSPTNRLVAETDPLGRVTRAGYDGAGRQLWQTDATGSQVSWTYDTSGRRETVSCDGRLIAKLERDLAARRVVIHDQTGNTPVRHELEWDRNGRLIRKSRNGHETSWGYTADGQRAWLQDPAGARVDYGYDAHGQLVTVEHTAFGVASFTRDTAGRITAAAAGGSRQSWAYQDGWLHSYEVQTPEGEKRTRITRDSDGRIATVERSGATTHYEYDEAGQLISATGPDRRDAWQYDVAGRLVSESVGHQVTEFTYDAAAQLLQTRSSDGSTTTHSYDAAGRRIGSTSSLGAVQSYEWNALGWLQSIATTSEDGATSSTNIWVDAAGELARVDDTDLWWDSAAYMPRPVAIGDQSVLAAGGVTGVGQDWLTPGWRPGGAQSGDPWAETPAASVLGLGVTANGGVSIGGLDWLGARVFDPASREFLTTDPLLPPTGAVWSGNPYSYAGNNPLSLADPVGLSPVTDAQLQAYYEANQTGFIDHAGAWLADNWEYLAGGAMVLAGGVLMATGVGGPLGGALMGAGVDTILQKATTGEVDWGQVALGAVMGAVGGAAGAGLARKVAVDGLRKAILVGVVDGGLSGGVSGGYSYATSPGPHTITGFLAATAQGTVSGAAIGGAGGAAGELLDNVFNPRTLANTGDGITTVYRVESPANARLNIEDGSLQSIQGDTTLFLNFGDEARADAFLQRRLEQGFSDTTIRSFDVPASYADRVASAAVPESAARGQPVFSVDTTQTPSSYGLRSSEFEELVANAIPGSAK